MMSELEGGMIWADSPTTSISMIETTKIDSVKSDKGGVLFIGPSVTSVTLNINTAEFLKINSVTNGGFLYLDGSSAPSLNALGGPPYHFTSSKWYCSEADLWY